MIPLETIRFIKTGKKGKYNETATVSCKPFVRSDEKGKK